MNVPRPRLIGRSRRAAALGCRAPRCSAATCDGSPGPRAGAAERARRAGGQLEHRSTDGTRLHAEVFGPEDGPTIVLAHGWTEMLDYWTYVTRRSR